MNSRNIFSIGYKTPSTLKYRAVWEGFFGDTERYIKSLKYGRQDLLNYK